MLNKPDINLNHQLLTIIKNHAVFTEAAIGNAMILLLNQQMSESIARDEDDGDMPFSILSSVQGQMACQQTARHLPGRRWDGHRACCQAQVHRRHQLRLELKLLQRVVLGPRCGDLFRVGRVKNLDHLAEPGGTCGRARTCVGMLFSPD